MLTTMDGTLDRPATGAADGAATIPQPQGFPSATPQRPRRPRFGGMGPPSRPNDGTPSVPSLNGMPGTPLAPGAHSGVFGGPQAMTAGQGMGMPKSEVGGAATPFATPPGAAPTTANLSAPSTAPAAAPAAAPPAAAAPQMPTPPAPPAPPSAPPASGSVPTAGIDPTNDLRSRAVLPQDDANLADARTRLMGADSAVGGYDRVAAIKDAIGQFGGQMPDDVARGPDVTAGPSEQGALDTLSGQVSGAAGKVAGYDRNADVRSIRDQLAQYFGNTDVSEGPTFDPGKDYTGDVNTADASTMNALSRVTGRDRTGLATNLRSGFDQYFGPTDVKAGPAIDAGPSVAGDLSNADRMTMDTAGRLTGTDRTQLASGLRDQFGNYLKPTDLSTRAAVDPTASARLNRLSGMTDASAGGLAAVDRVKMAQDLLKQFSDSTNPEYDLALRQATDKAVAAGGARSGQLRTKYGDLALTRARDLDLEKRRVMSDALSGSIEDAFRKTGALQGLEGQVAGQESATRGEQRTERGYATGIEAENIAAQQAAKSQAAGLGESAADATLNARQGAYNTASNLASNLSNREQVRRTNLSNERAYTTDVGTGNVARQLATRAQAAGLGESAADATLGADQNALNAARGVSSELSSRQQVRGANQRADQATRTAIETGNVGRRLATKEAANAGATTQAGQNFGTAADALSALSGLQSATAGREAGRRGELRTERDTATGLAERNAARRAATTEANRTFGSNVASGRAQDLLARTGSASNLFGTLANDAAAQRGEVRGERANQVGMEDQSYQRALTQEQLQQQEESQRQARALALLDAGEAGNPSGVMGALSEAPGSIDPAMIAQLAATLGRNPAGPARVASADPNRATEPARIPNVQGLPTDGYP